VAFGLFPPFFHRSLRSHLIGIPPSQAARRSRSPPFPGSLQFPRDKEGRPRKIFKRVGQDDLRRRLSSTIFQPSAKKDYNFLGPEPRRLFSYDLIFLRGTNFERLVVSLPRDGPNADLDTTPRTRKFSPPPPSRGVFLVLV